MRFFKKLIKKLSLLIPGGIIPVGIYCFSFSFVFAESSFRGLTQEKLDKIVSIIFLIEGSEKADYLYGIKIKIKAKTYSERKRKARTLCEETVTKFYNSWIFENNGEPFWDYLSNHYCPKETDKKGWINWRKNYVYFAAKNGVLF